MTSRRDFLQQSVVIAGRLAATGGGSPSRSEAASSSAPSAVDAAPLSFEIVVFGGTPAGIVAAVQAARMNKTVVLVCPETHLGGMTSSGLGWTDSKNGKAVGGLAREFYHRVWLEYQKPERWHKQTRKDYQAGAQPGPGRDDKNQVMWTFEPHVAELVFENWLKDEKVPVFRGERLVRNKKGIQKQGGRIVSCETSSGKRFVGKMFIDAGYEGDLMALAGVSHRTGRDSVAEYNEPLNGIRFLVPGDRGFTGREYPGIDPYRVKGDKKSGLIAGIEGEWDKNEKIGEADFKRLQCFNYRLCLTKQADNRVPFAKPDGYNEAEYELLLRLAEAGKESSFTEQLMPNLKTDSNNHGAMSLDFVGGSFSASTPPWTYSDATDEQRTQIVQNHRRYTEGLVWTMQNHPRIPQATREKLSAWGWAKDEFVDNGYFPYQMYVREARRMDGQKTMTQHHVQRKPGYDEVKDSVGLGSYSLDSHVVRRIVVDGQIRNEGGFYIWWDVPYPISYGAIVPKKQSEAENLLVPVTLSATHAAFGSIRMEPTYMILGQAAGTAACLALDARLPVQSVPYGALSARLTADKQILTWAGPLVPTASPV